MAINDCITTAYNIHLMGILSGLSNMVVNSILGKQGAGLVTDFFDGYQNGVWTAGILYLTAMISVKAFAVVAFGTAVVETIASVVMLVAAITEGNKKEVLVYGALTILSVINIFQIYNISGEIWAFGDKGSATIIVEGETSFSIGNGKQYSVMYEANTGRGKSRSAHRNAANKQFYNQMKNDPEFKKSVDDYFGYDVMEYMKSGKGSLKIRHQIGFGIILQITLIVFN